MKPIDEMTTQERAVELARVMGWNEFRDWKTPYPNFFMSKGQILVAEDENKIRYPWQPEDDRNDLAEAEEWALKEFPEEYSTQLKESLGFRGIAMSIAECRRATPEQIVKAILAAGRGKAKSNDS